MGKHWKERVRESGVCGKCVLASCKEFLPGGLEWRDITKSAVKGFINHACTWKIKRIKIKSDRSTNYFHGCSLMKSTGTPQTEAQGNLRLQSHLFGFSRCTDGGSGEALRLQRRGKEKPSSSRVFVSQQIHLQMSDYRAKTSKTNKIIVFTTSVSRNEVHCLQHICINGMCLAEEHHKSEKTWYASEFFKPSEQSGIQSALIYFYRDTFATLPLDFWSKHH